MLLVDRLSITNVQVCRREIGFSGTHRNQVRLGTKFCPSFALLAVASTVVTPPFFANLPNLAHLTSCEFGVVMKRCRVVAYKDTRRYIRVHDSTD